MDHGEKNLLASWQRLLSVVSGITCCHGAVVWLSLCVPWCVPFGNLFEFPHAPLPRVHYRPDTARLSYGYERQQKPVRASQYPEE